VTSPGFRPEEIARRFAPPERPAPFWHGEVHAAVLTYNRKELLLLCLEALRAQTEKPERVIVVDNGSTDGTAALLRETGFLDDPRFRYVRLDANIGAAAGFARLFAEVWRGGAAWGWFMDDDVVAAPAALAELKRAFALHFERPEEIGFLVSNAVTPDGAANDVPIVDDRRPAGASASWGDYLASGLVKVRSSALNSVLIPRSTLAAFGQPSLDFVVWGEDTDYCLRVTEERPGYIVGRSRIVHLRGVAGDLDLFAEPEGPRLDRFYYLYRNTMYLRRRYWPRHGVYAFLGKAALHFARSFLQPRARLRRAMLVLRGTLAGLRFAPRYVPLESLAGDAAPLGKTHQRAAGHGARLLEAEKG
jgi:GT2 family glycosyltransferase